MEKWGVAVDNVIMSWSFYGICWIVGQVTNATIFLLGIIDQRLNAGHPTSHPSGDWCFLG